MTLAEFQDLLDAHGVHLSSWPDELRARAERFLPRAGGRQRLRAQRFERLITRGEPAGSGRSMRRPAALRALAGDLPRPRDSASAACAVVADGAAVVRPGAGRLRIAALAGIAALGVALGLLRPDFGSGDRAPVAWRPGDRSGGRVRARAADRSETMTMARQCWRGARAGSAGVARPQSVSRGRDRRLYGTPLCHRARRGRPPTVALRRASSGCRHAAERRRRHPARRVPRHAARSTRRATPIAGRRTTCARRCASSRSIPRRCAPA